MNGINLMELVLFPLEESHGFIMRLAANRMKSGLNRAFQSAGLDHTAEQWSVLSALVLRDGQSQTEVGQNVTKDRQTITRIIDALELGGLVQRRAHPSDRRCNLVFITEAGRQAHQRLTEAAAEFTRLAFAGLSQSELAELARLNKLIAHNIELMNAQGEET